MGKPERKNHTDKPEPPPPPYAPSTSVQTPAGFHSGPLADFAMVHLYMTDRIRLLGFPPSVIEPLDEAIRGIWKLGVPEAGPMDGAMYGWSLYGNPWVSLGPQAMQSRRVIMAILQVLSLQGWHLTTSACLSKRRRDKNSLVFKKGIPRSRTFFSVFFEVNNMICLVDPPKSDVAHAFILTIRSWAFGAQEEPTKEAEGLSYKFKLAGSPWRSEQHDEGNHARLMLMSLLSALDGLGYELVGSVDMSSNSSDSDDKALDSWVFASKIP